MVIKSDKKRTFLLLRTCILTSLSTGVKTINQIAKENSMNWKTVESHLTYLLGKGYVLEIFNSQYVRIFELTPAGKKNLDDFNRIIPQYQNQEEEEILQQ